MSGEHPRWMRRLYQHITRLPTAKVLLNQLTDLVETGVLDNSYPLLAS
jgi:hypothetical protein